VRTLLVNGQIYSPAENFATAILIEDDVIAWIGSEGGADVHRREVDEVIDVAGDLITPGFVNLATDEVNVLGGFVHAEPAEVPIADCWPEQTWQDHSERAVAVVPRPPCRLRSRISRGTPTALVPVAMGRSGWQTVRSAVYDVEPAERLTARGAFNALTRSAWRILGWPERGVLAVGSEATFVRWSTDDLVIETPDERISNWSTDPRAATPGLPPLHPSAELPEVSGVWLAGVSP
jgi:hypothetical protein